MGVKNLPPIAPRELMLKDEPLRSAIFNFLFFAASANSLISVEISTIDFNCAFLHLAQSSLQGYLLQCLDLHNLLK